MKNTELVYLDAGKGGYVVVMPEVILVFDYCSDSTSALATVLTDHPSIPVVFLISGAKAFAKQLFDEGGTRERTFVLSTAVDHDKVPEGSPVSWLDAGDVMPAMPGGVSVQSLGEAGNPASFLVRGAGGCTVFYSDSLNATTVDELGSMTEHLDLALVPCRDIFDGKISVTKFG